MPTARRRGVSFVSYFQAAKWNPGHKKSETILLPKSQDFKSEETMTDLCVYARIRLLCKFI